MLMVPERSECISIKPGKHGSRQPWQLEPEAQSWGLTSATTEGNTEGELKMAKPIPSDFSKQYQVGPNMQILQIMGDDSFKPPHHSTTFYLVGLIAR